MPIPLMRVLGLLCAAVLLVACADDDIDDAATTPDTPEPADEDPADEDPPEEGAAEEPDAVEEPDSEPEEVDLDVEVVTTGLEAPWEVVFAPDGRTFVTERDSGRLVEIDDEGTATEVRTFDVHNAGEGGLLGLAVSPDYDDDGLLYVYYTTGSDNRVVRVEPDGGTEEEVLTGIPNANIHNGGRIAFGPAGQLHIGTGDAGDPALSQDPDSLAGKVLRITPDGDVPDDNPDVDSPVYASGLRNVQGLAWDDDDVLYVGELGADVDDALLRVEAGSEHGWGPDTAGAGEGQRPFPDPVAVKQPPEASWSGIALLSDGAIPQWEGDLFVAALRGERLWRFDPAGEDEEELLVGDFGRLRQVVQAPDGALWVLTTNLDGRGRPDPDDDRILRLGPAANAE